MRRYALFRGCFIPVRLPHLEQVARKVLGELGVGLLDIGGFSCCPEPVGFGLNDKLTWLALAARNISLAEEAHLDIITLCNGCLYTLKQANDELRKNELLRGRINEALAPTGHLFRGSVEVKHFAHTLVDDIGLDEIERRIVTPLNGLRVACHTGCHIISPVDVMRFDNPYDPTVLDQMVSALGATPVDYDLKPLCCGWTLTNYGSRSASHGLLGEKLAAMKEANADCVAVMCPQCFYQFDTSQLLAVRALKLGFSLPVMYYLQLLALAMGHAIEEVHCDHHRIVSAAFEEKLRRIIS